MPTYGTVLNVAGPGTGPVEPDPLHSNGVTGATHRYVPGRELAAGAEVTTLEDLIGSLDLVAGANDIAPTIADVAGNRVLRWSPATNRSLSAPAALDGPLTLAAVVKASRVGFIVSRLAGYNLSRATDPSFMQFTARNAADTGTGSQLLSFVDDYVVMFMLIDATPANSRVAINNTVASNAGTIGAINPAYDTALQVGPGSAQTGNGDIAEMNVWPAFLDATQRTAHIAAMKAKWSMIPA